ncbi:MAG: MFS transporter [Burkholderiales bacterium]
MTAGEGGVARPPYWSLLLPAALMLMVTMGIRQSMGLFVSPLNSSTGLGIVAISFALAVGQLMWGVAQPIFGAVADRYGPGRVLVLGGLLGAAGIALAPLLPTRWGLVITLGVLASAGAGAGAFSILIGAVAKRLPAERRSFAAGFINAGGSFGQFVFAPLVQGLITAFGWMSALYSLAALSIAALPFARPLRGRAAPKTATATAGLTLREQLRVAMGDRSYLLLHASFFTCGVHVAFLMTHLPGEVALCGLSAQVSANAIALIGLANIAGSLAAGTLGQHFRLKNLLFCFYAARTILILGYLAAPKTPLTLYIFAVGMGFTFLATVPPTAGLVGKLFGMRYMATLFGLTLFSHQVGGFFGAWLGGVTVVSTGSYQWMWYADAALALAAALLNLPIREAPLSRGDGVVPV